MSARSGSVVETRSQNGAPVEFRMSLVKRLPQMRRGLARMYRYLGDGSWLSCITCRHGRLGSIVATPCLEFFRNCAAASQLGRVPRYWVAFHRCTAVAIGWRGGLDRRRLRAPGRRTCRNHRHVDLGRVKTCHFGRAHPLEDFEWRRWLRGILLLCTRTDKHRWDNPFAAPAAELSANILLY